MATAEEYAKMSASEKKKEDWMNSKWRPMMGWSYMLTCITDFVVFPILWSIAQMIGGGEVKMQWQPITLMGAGLYHVAMGAVLGLAAWGRTQEKLNGANNGGLSQSMGTSMPTTFSTPSSGGFSSAGNYGSTNAVFGGSSQSFQQPAGSNFGTAASGNFNAAPMTVAASASVPFVTNAVVAGPGGKPAPVQPDHPEI